MIEYFQRRMCTLCNNLEDEFHLLFECKAYNDIRVKYIKRYYRVGPNMIKTTELMLSEHVKTQRNIAAFIYHAFEIKKSNYSVIIHVGLMCVLIKLFLKL